MSFSHKKEIVVSADTIKNSFFAIYHLSFTVPHAHKKELLWAILENVVILFK